jgi:mannose-6-phosphate isomerase-like protein (cupin superfamily)
MHIHHEEDEVLVIIDRQFEVTMGEASSMLAPGDIAFVPRGTAHTIRKVGEGFGRVVSIHTPGGVEHFFRAHQRAPTTSRPCRRRHTHRSSWQASAHGTG